LYVTGLPANRSPVAQNLSLIEKWQLGPAYVTDVRGIDHSHFVTAGGGLAFLGDDSSNAETFGSCATCWCTLFTDDAYFLARVDAPAIASQAASVRRTGRPLPRQDGRE